jgi:hypothetical protein
MTSNVYALILENELRPSVKQLFDSKPYVLQHGNDPKHSSRHFKEYIQDQGISLLNWPAQSPDLNPIENLWSILDNKCSSRHCTTVANLFRTLKDEWDRIPVETLEKLVDSMPARIDAVIAAKGYPTHF